MQPLLGKLHAFAIRRKEILEASSTLWDEHNEDWSTRTSARLPAGEFCDDLSQDLEFFHELQVQADEQGAIVEELRVGVLDTAVILHVSDELLQKINALARKYCITFGAVGEEPVSLESVRRSLQQYAIIYNGAGIIKMVRSLANSTWTALMFYVACATLPGCRPEPYQHPRGGSGLCLMRHRCRAGSFPCY